MYMEFNEFTNRIVEEINRKVGNSNVRIQVQEVKRPNASYIGLALGKANLDLACCANLETAYAFAREHNFEEGAIGEVANAFASAIDRIPSLNLEWLKNYDKAKTRLFPRVCNARCEGLMDYPHTTFLDLAITYAIRIESEDGMIGAAPVTSGMLSLWGKKLTDLVRDVKNSQEKVMPPKFMSMTDILPLEIFEAHDQQPLYVLTNTESYCGAGVIFYPGMMEKIAEKLGGDYFVIPSSIHETLLLPANTEVEIDGLSSIIQAVNRDCLAPADKLSDHAYRYNTATREFVAV